MITIPSYRKIWSSWDRTALKMRTVAPQLHPNPAPPPTLLHLVSGGNKDAVCQSGVNLIGVHQLGVLQGARYQSMVVPPGRSRRRVMCSWRGTIPPAAWKVSRVFELGCGFVAHSCVMLAINHYSWSRVNFAVQWMWLMSEKGLYLSVLWI